MLTLNSIRFPQAKQKFQLISKLYQLLKSYCSYKKVMMLSFMPCFSFTVLAQTESDTTMQRLSSIEGTWSIDLRPTPSSQPYLKQFMLTLKEDSTFEGEFYDSPIYSGLLNKNWEKVYFAFHTRDSSNAYFHSGYWDGEKIYGMTYCPDRNFVAPWVGVKKE